MVSTRAVRLTLAGLAGLILVGLGAALDAELWHTSAVPPSASSEGPASVVGQADGAPAVHKTCFPCHEPAKGRDFVFTRYAP